jgi:hypothetical protein
MDAVTPPAISHPAAAARGVRRLLRARVVGAAMCACVLGLGAFPALAADAATALERSVKAAYLYKFLSYVEWPAPAAPAPNTPFVIGVCGAEEILAELQKIAPERTVADRPLEVRRIKEGDPLSGLHVLFVGRSESAHLADMARTARQNSILTVSEIEGALRLGSVINLIIVDGHVRFEIALDAAEKSGLKLSSRLLALAPTVQTGGK